MAEDTRPDADFSELAPQKAEKLATPVVNSVQDQATDQAIATIQDSVDDRIDKVAGGETRGDKVADILRSIEKSMFLQTEFLSRISATASDQISFEKEQSEDTKRAESLAGVSDPEPQKDDRSMMDKVKDKALGLGRGARDTLIGSEEDSGLKKTLKTLATAVAGGLVVSGFVGAAAKDGLQNLGFSPETSENVGESVGDATGMGTTAAVLASSLKFFTGKGPGGLKAFAATAVAKLTYDAIGSLDIDEDGKILGIKNELVQLVGGGLAGIATFVGVGKSFKALGTGLKKSFNFAKNKLGGGPKVPKVDVPKPTTSSTKAITNATKVATKGLSATATTAAQALPNALNVPSTGVVSQGTPSTVSSIAEKLKGVNPEKAAKFAKFFKFAGPAAAIIPALIEPAMAIYNDEPDDVIKTQIAGALGSVGGATLGSIAGTTAGAALGLGAFGVGAVPGGIIGGFIGGISGAFAGEWLLEKMTNALMGGPEVNPEDMNKINDEAKPEISSGEQPKKPSQSVKAQIVDIPKIDKKEAETANALESQDSATKSLEAFKSTAKSGEIKMVQEEGQMGDFLGPQEKLVFSDAEEQAQYDSLLDQKSQADMRVQDARAEMIGMDALEPNTLDKIDFLQEKGLLPASFQGAITMGKFESGPLEGLTPDEAIDNYVRNQKQAQVSVDTQAQIPTIVPDKDRVPTEDGKIPAKVLTPQEARTVNIKEAVEAKSNLEEFKKTAGPSTMIDGQEVFEDAEEQEKFQELKTIEKASQDKLVSEFKDAPIEQVFNKKYLESVGGVEGISPEEQERSRQRFAQKQFLRSQGILLPVSQTDEDLNNKINNFVKGYGIGTGQLDDVESQDGVMETAIRSAEIETASDVKVPVQIEDGVKDLTKNEIVAGEKDGTIKKSVATRALMDIYGSIKTKETATGDDVSSSLEKAETNLATAKAAFAEAEKDDTLRETLEGEMKYSQLQADIAFAEQDLADANARAAASGAFIKRMPEAPKSIIETSGIESAPEKLMSKSKAISDDKATQDAQGQAIMMQNLSKGGDTTTVTNTRGGDRQTINIVKGGSSSLGNSHIPVPQSV
jgi:hypothetical protein